LIIYNTFFSEKGSVGFTTLSKGSMAQENVKHPLSTESRLVTAVLPRELWEFFAR